MGSDVLCRVCVCVAAGWLPMHTQYCSDSDSIYAILREARARREAIFRPAFIQVIKMHSIYLIVLIEMPRMHFSNYFALFGSPAVADRALFCLPTTL